MIFLIAWIVSSTIFSVYIFWTYILNPNGQWLLLPDLVHDTSPKLLIFIHFIGGIVINILGPIQVSSRKYHKQLGKIFIISSYITSLAGLLFIFVRGTVGGTIMSMFFFIYGLLMLYYTYNTYYYAVRKDFTKHMIFAIRLLSFTYGSMIYRLLYTYHYLFNIKVDFRGYYDILCNCLLIVIPYFISTYLTT